MKKIGCKILDALCFISEHLAVIGGVALIAMMVITATDVILRMFDKSILGSMELIQYLMIVTIFLSFGKATLDDSFTKVEIINFKGAEVFVKHLMDVLHVVLCLISSYFCFSESLVAMKMGTSSQMLRIVRWPFLLIAGIGFILVAVSVPLANYRNKKRAKAAADNGQAADPESNA